MHTPRSRSLALGVISVGVASYTFAAERPRPPRAPDRRPPAVAAGAAPAAHRAAQPARAAARCALGPRPAALVGRGGRGGTVALAPDESFAVTADADNDAVAVVSLARSGARLARTFRVGRAPSQVVVGSDGRVFVAERLANTVGVYDPRDGRVLCRARVAADPAGLALAPDERTLYVASGVARALTALDGDTLATRFVAAVPREPRGLAVSPDGAHVFVSHLAGQPVSAFDVRGAAAVARAIPAVPIAPDPTRRRARRRRWDSILFDVAFKPTGRRDGRSLPMGGRALVARAPSAHASARVPLPSQAWSVAYDELRGRVVVAFMVNRTGRDLPVAERHDVYGGGAVRPGPEPEKTSFALGSFDPVQWRWERVALPEGDGATSRVGRRVRIPSGIAVRADGSLAVAAMGSDLVASLAIAGGITRKGARDTLAAPCGIAVTRAGLELVYSQFDHALEVRDATARAVIPLGDDPLAPDVARGRRLFHAAADARISSGGLSCGGCHPDGRDDGLVWFLSQGPRQTPTLAGRIEAPFNWNGTQRTMEGNIAQTVRRLGGRGLPAPDVAALAAYLARGLRAPRVAAADADAPEDPRVARGRALFSGDAACDACHDPARNFTDGVAHVLGGLRRDETRRAFDTPSLRYLAATAPYFHDGRYPTLRALLADRRHNMGHADALSAGDVDALLAYLETL